MNVLDKITDYLNEKAGWQSGSWVVQKHPDFNIYMFLVDQLKNGGWSAITIDDEIGGRNTAAKQSIKNVYPEPTLIDSKDVPTKIKSKVEKKAKKLGIKNENVRDKIDNYLAEAAEMYLVRYRAKDKKGKVIDKEWKTKATSKESALAMAKRRHSGRRGQKYFDGTSAKKIDEAIRFETEKYEGSHGRKPKGQGNWAFEVKGKTIWVKGIKSYTDAKKQMSKDYKNDKNVFSVTVLP